MFICIRCLLIFSAAGFLIPHTLSARITEHYSDYKDEDKNESSQFTHEDDRMKLEMKPHDINEDHDKEFLLDNDASYQVISNAIKDEKEEEFVDDENEKRSTNDSSAICDFTQFGSNHSAVLPPMEKCEKFRLIAGEIYKRGVSEEDIQAILRTHNELRSKLAGGLQTQGNPGPQPSGANIREMIWNDQLAQSAQGWADQCALKHDKGSNRQTCEYKRVGQNVGHKKSKDNKPSTVQWENIINNFHSEVNNMPNYDVGKLKKPPKGFILHYTQMVWAKTYELGCGVVYYYLYKEKTKTLKRETARSFVCNYGPSGNYIGAPVYDIGPAASNCDNGVSSNYPNLCAPPAS